MNFIKIKRYILSLFKLLGYKILYGKNLKIHHTRGSKLPFFGKGSRILLDKGSKLIISDNDYFDDYVYLSSRDGGYLEIKPNVYINTFGKIYCIDHIEIGENSIMGSNISIYDHNHRQKGEVGSVKRSMEKGSTVVQNNCWLGANAILLMGGKLPANSILGAGAVLNKVGTEPGTYVGMPAKLIKSTQNIERE